MYNCTTFIPINSFTLQVLETFLKDLWETELACDLTGLSAFCSQTTLEALRITTLRTIELTNHLLSKEINYEFLKKINKL
jgi:hypothetical protein